MNTEIWTFKYEPNKFEDIILNDDIRLKLKKTVKEIPNLMLIGPPGVGKGTFTNYFLKETKLDFIKINCSDETGIDNLRTKVKSFAQTLGTTSLKIVVMNEFDYISPNAQAMLRDLMEQVQSITRFIFQCNYSHKIIKEILSRCQIIDINNPPAKEIYQHLTNILTNENINIKNKRVIVDLIKGLYPDIRKMINTLQLNSVGGVINDSISTDSDLYTDILNSMKKQDIEDVRRILRSNTIDYVSLYQHLFDNIGEFKSPGDAILLIGEHLYRDGLIAIKEINFMTMFVLMLKNGSL